MLSDYPWSLSLAILMGLLVGSFAFSNPVRKAILASEFWCDFTATIFATALGVFLSVQTTLEIDQAAGEVDRRQAEQELLKAIAQSLSQNRSILEKVVNNLNPGSIVHVNVDPLFLESTAEMRYRVVDDLSLNQSFEILRFELGTLHKMIEAQFDLAYGIESRTTNGTEMRNNLINNIKIRVEHVFSLLTQVSGQIEEKLKTNSNNKSRTP